MWLTLYFYGLVRFLVFIKHTVEMKEQIPRVKYSGHVPRVLLVYVYTHVKICMHTYAYDIF